MGELVAVIGRGCSSIFGDGRSDGRSPWTFCMKGEVSAWVAAKAWLSPMTFAWLFVPLRSSGLRGNSGLSNTSLLYFLFLPAVAGVLKR